MPVDVGSMLEVVRLLCEEKDLKVTVRESLRGGLYVGAAAVTGGILLGPVGLAVGGTVGGFVAAYMAHGKFQPVAVVILHMNDSEKQQLASAVHKVIAHLDATDALMLTQVLMGDLTLQKEVIATIVNFLRNDMRMDILD